MTSRRVPLGDLGRFVGGGTPSRKIPEYFAGQIPWATVKDFKSDRIASTLEFLSEAGLKNSSARLVPKGSLLIVSRMGLGKAAVAEMDLAINQDIKAFVPNGDHDTEFLLWCLKALGPEIERLGTGATVKGVTLQDLGGLPIPLPPIEEQRRIVDILNRAASIERLRRQASAHLRDFIPALFLKMFGDPIENPMGWPTVRLREIVSEFRYGTSKKSRDEAVEGASPILRIPNVIGGAVNLEDLKYTVLDAKEQSRLTLQRGDLLFVRTNGNPEYIGRCAVFDLSLDAAYASYLIRARVQETAPVSPFVIGDLLSLPSMRKVLLTLATTTAGNYNINIESLGSIVVPVPPRDAQDRYLSLAKAAKSRMSLASDSSVLAGNLSKSLLDKLLGADRS